jgi:hypothetical protein
MKKLVIPLLVLLVTGVLRVSGQVSINTDGSPPDNSAMLNVKSTSKGVLLPRVALVSADLPTPVAAPATGLIVYNTSVSGTGMNAVFPGYYFWNGQRWKSIEKTFDYYPYLTLPDGCTVTGTTYWSSPNGGATNESCFSALPAGCEFGMYMAPRGWYVLNFHEAPHL